MRGSEFTVDEFGVPHGAEVNAFSSGTGAARSRPTLEEVIEHYSDGGKPNPALDEEIRPLDLGPKEKRHLIAFLEALTGD